jgi:hypothetical protein
MRVALFKLQLLVTSVLTANSSLTRSTTGSGGIRDDLFEAVWPWEMVRFVLSGPSESILSLALSFACVEGFEDASSIERLRGVIIDEGLLGSKSSVVEYSAHFTFGAAIARRFAHQK